MFKIRITRILFGASICLFFMTSCQRQTNGTIAELKSRVFENPDSVDLVLNGLLPDYNYMHEADKALFDLCRFQVASFYPENFPPVEYINSAISHFEKQKNTKYLTEAYYSKSLYYKEIRDFEQANVFLLKARDFGEKINHNAFLARIYFDIGHIAYMQNLYEYGLEYLDKALLLHKELSNMERVAVIYDISSMAALSQKDNEAARLYSFKALEIATDSTVIGDLYSNIGQSYSYDSQFDSAYYYLNLSLEYPTYQTNRSLRYHNVAELFASVAQYDSVEYYLTKAFELPIDIYIAEDSYRLLSEAALHMGNKQKAAEYMELRTRYNDTIRNIEYQPDVTIVNRLHDAAVETRQQQSRQRYFVTGIVALLIIIVSLFILLWRKKRANEKIAEALKQYKEELNTLSTNNKEEQERKINAFKAELLNHISSSLNEKNKSRSFMEKEQQRKNAYIEFLNIDKEELFISNMNLLSLFPDKLKQRFKSINYKEIVWCCLFVLDVSASDIALILNYTQTSQYKFKQRLIKKLQFPNTKEFEIYLSNLVYTDA